jgi:cobalamin transport system substrate-binding protein
MFIRKFILIVLAFFFVISATLVYADSPQRIISGMPSVTEILYSLGLGDRIVGVTTNCNYPERAQMKKKIGGFFLNLERIVSLKPDMVVMLEGAQKQEIRRFREFGLPVYTINPNSVEEVMASILELGELTGTKPRAEEIVAAMDEKLNTIKYETALFEPGEELLDLAEEGEVSVLNSKQPEVLVIIGMNPLVVVGGETLIDDMLGYSGASNIAQKTNAAYPQYSFENLLSENPDYIIIPKGVVRKEEMKRDARWNSLSAVKHGHVMFISADKLSRPGPRIVEAIEEIANFIYQ